MVWLLATDARLPNKLRRRSLVNTKRRRQGLTNTKVDEGGKGAVCWLREREKTERTWRKERAQTLKTFHVQARKKGFVQCIRVKGYQLRLISPTSTLIILDITKTSSNNCLVFYGFMLWLLITIERFHMTSRQPYWCSKTMKRRLCWCFKPIQ